MRKLLASVLAAFGLSLTLGAITVIDLKTDLLPDPLVLTADYEYTNSGSTTKDLTIDVADRETTTTCAALVSGNIRLVKTGAGMLEMTAENTYTGGTRHSGGHLKAGNASAFGATDRPIVLDADYDAVKAGFYGLILPDGTYSYDIDRVTSQAAILYLGGRVVFNGDITDSTETATGSLLVTQIANVNSGSTNTFNGTITMPKANLVSCCYHNNAFNGKITVNQVQSKTGESTPYTTFYPVAQSCGGTFYLNAANDIKAIWIRANGIVANAAGAFGDGSAYVELSAQVYGNGKLTLETDQTVSYLKGVPDNIKGATSDNAQFTSSTPRTLTVAGTKTEQTGIAVNGKVSLVYEPTGDYRQSFVADRVNKTTGSLTALSRGTLELGGTTTWKNVPTITAGAGARVLVSTTGEDPLSGVRTLNVAGTVEVAAGLANPFTGLTVMTVTSTSSVKLPSGTALEVALLMIDGEPVVGTFTEENCDWLKGTGVSVTCNRMTLTKADYDALTVDTVTVPEDVTLEVVTDTAATFAFEKAIVGEGSVKVVGDGEVVFSAANSYAGGLFIDGAATVRGTDAAAFGTGTVQLGGKKAAVYLQTGTATFANDFVLTNNAVIAFVPTANNAKITVGGSVTATADFFVALTAYKVELDKTGCSYTFAGPINAPGKAMTFLGPVPVTVDVNFRGSITAARVRCNSLTSNAPYDNVFGTSWGYSNSFDARFYFYAANQVDVFVPYWTAFCPKHPQAFTAISTLASADTRKNSDYHHGSTVDFGGLSMTVGSLEALDINGYPIGKDNGCGALTSSSSATLAVVGGGTYVSDAIFKGRLSLDYNPPETTDTIILTNRAHSTAGKLTVSKGTVHAAGEKVSFTSLTAIEVKAGATFILDTSVAGALKSVRSIVLEEGATLKVVKGTDPFADGQAVVEIVSDGKIDLGEGVVAKFGAVRLDGVMLEDKDYTSAAWLTGSGTAKVNSSALSATLWKNATSGDWATAANWTKGIPASGLETRVTASGKSYEVSVSQDAGAIGPLSVGNAAAGETATVAVAAPMTLSAAEGSLVVMAGGRVKVGAGGSVALPRGSLDSTAESVSVQDGGVLKVAGGEVTLTNYTGRVNVGHDGKIEISAGTLRVRPGSGGRALTVDDGGVIEVSGGELLFSSNGWNGDGLAVRKGAKLDVSGDAVVGLVDGTTYTRVFGDGETTFRGHSTFGRAVTGGVGGWGQCFGTGSGAPTGTVNFIEYARFNDTGSSLMFDRGSGLVAQVILGSEANHVFANKTYLGGGDGGRGELIVTNGVLKQSGEGLHIAGAYEKQNATSALTAEGYLRVTAPAQLNVYCASGLTGDFRGLVIGDGAIATTNKTTGLGYGDTMRGFAELEGGLIQLGSAAAFVIGVGNPNVFGRMVQTGGTFDDTSESDYGQAAIGMGGGTGEWLMSGGTATLKCNLFVGGALLADFHRTEPPKNGGRLYVGERDYLGQAKGLLKLTGGTMTLKKGLILSSDGEGTLELGPAANLKVEGALNALAGSKLVVDLTGYAGRSRTIMTCGSVTRWFDTVERKGESEGYLLVIDEDAGLIRIRRNSGLSLVVR